MEIFDKSYFNENGTEQKTYIMKRRILRKEMSFLLMLQVALLITSCKKTSNENENPKLGIEYMDAFTPGEAIFSLVFDGDPKIKAGIDILLWDQLDYESTCKKDFASEYYQKDGVNYLWVHLNDTMTGTYRIIGPADAYVDDKYIADNKIAIVSYNQEYDESKQPIGPYGNIEDRHRAYSGEIILKNDFVYDINNLDAIVNSTLDVKIKAAFAVTDIRAMECSGIMGIDGGSGVDGGSTSSCICLNPDGGIHECQAADLNENCCPDKEAETIEYTYETTARQCGYYCAISTSIDKNYCLDLISEDVVDSDTVPDCTGCESQDSSRIFVNGVYPDGRQLDLQYPILDLTYRYDQNDTEYKECIGGGPSLPEGYEYIWAFGETGIGDSILLKAALPNGVSEEVEVPHHYTGCRFENITYLVIVVSEEEDEITFKEPEIISPCDM